jgi:DNA-directed RNA polymerase subunit RPC12/RpoP
MANKKKLKCYKCNHKWDSKTQSKHYVTCPSCMLKIKVDQAKENGKKKED